MSTVSFVTVDVFTAERFAGNQLAVIPDARGLSEAQMQAIATEFGYSEVTFVLPPENPENTARVRIFTPTTEVPFAGHPNVGTAFVLGRQQEIFGRKPGGALRFEEKAGLVDVTLLRSDGIVTGARIVAPQALQIGPAIDAPTIAACASLRQDDLIDRTHPPVRISVGLPFAVAEVRDLDALSTARPNVSAFEEANVRYPLAEDSFSLFLYARTRERPGHVRARMFAPLDNVIEDPATGSASAALGAYLGLAASRGRRGGRTRHRTGRGNGAPQPHHGRGRQEKRHSPQGQRLGRLRFGDARGDRDLIADMFSASRPCTLRMRRGARGSADRRG